MYYKESWYCGCSVEAPLDAVKAPDGLGGELGEERRAEVEIVRRARITFVNDRRLDRLAAVCGPGSSVTVHASGRADEQETLMVRPQIGLRFGFGVAPGKLLKISVDTATMASASVLKMPQAPRPGA
jgi:hypothetical protein